MITKWRVTKSIRKRPNIANDCQNCLDAGIQCDKGHPSCSQCIGKRVQCPGYQMKFIHIDKPGAPKSTRKTSKHRATSSQASQLSHSSATSTASLSSYPSQLSNASHTSSHHQHTPSSSHKYPQRAPSVYSNHSQNSSIHPPSSYSYSRGENLAYPNDDISSLNSVDTNSLASSQASFTGSVAGSATGSLTGSLMGSLSGSLTGSLPGSLSGSLTGSLPGSLSNAAVPPVPPIQTQPVYRNSVSLPRTNQQMMQLQQQQQLRQLEQQQKQQQEQLRQQHLRQQQEFQAQQEQQMQQLQLSQQSQLLSSRHQHHQQPITTSSMTQLNSVSPSMVYPPSPEYPEYPPNSNAAFPSSSYSSSSHHQVGSKVGESPSLASSYTSPASSLGSSNTSPVATNPYSTLTEQVLKVIDFYDRVGSSFLSTNLRGPFNPVRAALLHAQHHQEDHESVIGAVRAFSAWYLNVIQQDNAEAIMLKNSLKYKSEGLATLARLLISIRNNPSADLVRTGLSLVLILLTLDESCNGRKNWTIHFLTTNAFLSYLDGPIPIYDANFKANLAWICWFDLSIALTSRRDPKISKNIMMQAMTSVEGSPGWDSFAVSGCPEAMLGTLHRIAELSALVVVGLSSEQVAEVQSVVQSANWCNETSETPSQRVWANGLLVYITQIFAKYLYTNPMDNDIAVYASRVVAACQDSEVRVDHNTKQVVLPLVFAAQYFDKYQRQWARDYLSQWQKEIGIRLYTESIQIMEQMWSNDCPWTSVVDQAQSGTVAELLLG